MDWKLIPNHKNYFVSDSWLVWKFKYEGLRPLKTYLNKTWQERIKLYDNKIKKYKTYLVSRLVYLLHNNLPLTTKDFVCHKDDNPSNNVLENLFLWTQSDNMKDCRNKWRLKVPSLKWELNHNSKLTKEIVRQIYLDYKNKISPSIILCKYDICKATYYNIIKWKSRAHVSR